MKKFVPWLVMASLVFGVVALPYALWYGPSGPKTPPAGVTAPTAPKPELLASKPAKADPKPKDKHGDGYTDATWREHWFNKMELLAMKDAETPEDGEVDSEEFSDRRGVATCLKYLPKGTTIIAITDSSWGEFHSHRFTVFYRKPKK